MTDTRSMFESEIRKTPLLDRLQECRRRIGRMCSEGRSPRMTIPVQADDDDFFISTTLTDAIDEIKASIEVIKILGIPGDIITQKN